MGFYKPELRLILFPLTFALVGIYLCWINYSTLNNTLSNNSNWISQKTNLGKAVYGAKEFENLPLALSGNKLNLGAWYGYQEIILKNMIEAKIITLDYFLETNSYLDIIIDKTDSNFKAVRISNSNDNPSIYYESNSSGKFTKFTNLDLKNQILVNRWQSINIQLLPKNVLTLTIDKNDPINFIISPLSIHRLIGFRGSYNPVFIDNIKTYDNSGKQDFTETFENRDVYILKIISIILCTIYLVVFIISYHLSRNLLDSIKYLALVQINSMSFLLITFLYINYFYINQYPNPNSKINKIIRSIKTKQNTSTNNSWHQEINQEIITNLDNLNKSKKIFFIGTSQTWGAGAMSENDTFVSQVEKLSLDHNKFKYINAGISGTDSTILLNYYSKYWANYKPILTIIILSNNDADPITFENNLKSFININKENNIKTLLVLEANSVEASPEGPVLGTIIKKIAMEENIPVSDLHSFLSTKKTTGLIWWDNVHLTNYGHELAGNFLYQEIKKIIF